MIDVSPARCLLWKRVP